MATPIAWSIGDSYLAAGASVRWWYGWGGLKGAQVATGTPWSTFSTSIPTELKATDPSLEHQWVLNAQGYVVDNWVYHVTITNVGTTDTWHSLTGGGVY